MWLPVETCAITVAHAPANTFELHHDDLTNDCIRQREIRHQRQTTHESRLEEFREFRPQRVYGPSPERNWDRVYASHPDHLAVGEATISAVYPDARNRWAHPELEREGLEPWTDGQTWIGGGAAGATHYIDITTSIDRKIEALLCHKSQLPDPVAMGEMVRGWTTMIAASAGLPEGRFAEAVRVVITG